MKFTKDLRPWADFHRIFSAMRSLDVKVDGKSVKGFDLSLDANSHATLEVSSGRKAKAGKTAKAA